MKISKGHKRDTVNTSCNSLLHIMKMVGVLVNVILTVPAMAKIVVM